MTGKGRFGFDRQIVPKPFLSLLAALLLLLPAVARADLAPRPPPQRSPERGCGCSVPGSATDAPSALAAAGLLAALACRRKRPRADS